MLTLIQDNQQLTLLISLIVFVMVFLWTLQHSAIAYGNKLQARLLEYGRALSTKFEIKQRLARFKVSHPKLYHFFWQRLHIEHFYGLPLTALVLVMGYVLSLFIGLVEDVVTSDSIVAIDHLVSQQMSVLSDSVVIDFFILITSLGSTPTTALVILLTSILCWMIAQRYLIVGLLIATVGSTAFTYLSKLLFQRDRPLDILLLEQTYSFPSGHATISIALYGFIAYLAVRFGKQFITQIRVVALTVFLCVLIGLSRIVLNEHYLSDVMGGYLVGTLWLTVAISVMEWLTAKDKINWEATWSSSWVYFVWFSVLSVLVATVIYANLSQFPLLQ